MVLVDTAGVRRRSKVKEDVEYYSVLRSIKAIKRADVVLVMLDASEGFTEQDQRIAGMAHEAGKGIIFVVNKWDLVTAAEKTLHAAIWIWFAGNLPLPIMHRSNLLRF